MCGLEYPHLIHVSFQEAKKKKKKKIENKLKIRKWKQNQTELTKKSPHKYKHLASSKVKPLLEARFHQISKNFTSFGKMGRLSPQKQVKKPP